MIKIKLYIRIGQTSQSYRVAASIKPIYKALDDNWKTVFPTIQFPIEVSVPQEIFDATKQELVAEIKLTKQNSDIKVKVADKLLKN